VAAPLPLIPADSSGDASDAPEALATAEPQPEVAR
jgi:hypothetical protein